MDPEVCTIADTTPVAPDGSITAPSAVESAVASALAFTGANIWMLLGIALLLVLIGLVLRSMRGIFGSHRADTFVIQDLAIPSLRPARNRTIVFGVSLVLVFAALTGATKAEAAPMAVGIATPCSFLELANVVVSPQSDAGIFPGPTYQILNATVTNESTFPIDITLRSVVSSDPNGAAAAVTLSGVHESSNFYAKLLSDTTSSSVIHLESGASVQLNFTATMSPTASNALQGAKINFDVIIDAIEAS